MLLTSIKLNDQTDLKNRIAMAPMTRCFADDDLVPNQAMVDYYQKRAKAGLIITEGTIISPQGKGYPNTPGIYTQAQINGWKKVTDAVHAEGGKIFCQIWHVGRVSHAIYLDGQQAVAPSAVLLEGRVPRAEDLIYEMPRALSVDEISEITEQFAKAAENAIKAGFDGIEIHAANGYLIDQFLHQESNIRDDIYGGSIENRARFALEVLTQCIEKIGADKVAIRLSPYGYFNMTHTAGDEMVFRYLLEQLNQYALAYVHVGMLDDTQYLTELEGRVCEFVRRYYQGTLMGNGSYNIELAQQDMQQGLVDMIAFGRPFIANPDLIDKIGQQQPWLPYDESMLSTLK